MHNQQQPNYDQYPQEIDLVDLAVVVYRRKWTLALVVLFGVIVSFGYWFSLGEKLQVSAVFTIGEKAMLTSESSVPALSPLMSALDTSELLNLIYIPQSIKSNKLETGTEVDQEDIEINYAVSKKDSEENTTILELFTEGSQQNAQALIPIFNDSLELLAKTHAEKLEEYKNRVRSIIKTKKSNLQLLNQQYGEDGEVEYRVIVEASVLSLETMLAASTNSHILKRATAESAEAKGLVVYVAGGLVSGLFLGCFLVFFLELYAKAKIRAAETA
jgi:hypothetical protein